MLTTVEDEDCLTGLQEHIGKAEIDLIQLLHGHTEHYVAFAVGDEDGIVPRVAVRSRQLTSHFPSLIPRDAYVSINQARSVHDTRVHVQPCHRTDTIAALCACYADLDYYKQGWNEAEVLAELARLSCVSSIPIPSMLVYSGRGIWPVWLFKAQLASNRPITPVQLEQHARIQSALHTRLAHLGSDQNAGSVVRYLRVPGSLNTKSETVVRWETQTDGNGQVPHYTLHELLSWLDLSAQAVQHIPAATPKQHAGTDWKNTRATRGQAGWRGLRDRRLRDFRKLCVLRGGGLSEGSRNHGIFYYSILMALNGIPIESATQIAMELNAHCKPPLTAAAVNQAIKSAYTRRYPRLSDQTIADWLAVTPGEVAQLECPAIATQFHSYSEPVPPKLSRREVDQARMARRHAIILRIISEAGGTIPTTRRMAASLREQGIDVNHVTVSADYKCLSSFKPALPVGPE